LYLPFERHPVPAKRGEQNKFTLDIQAQIRLPGIGVALCIDDMAAGSENEGLCLGGSSLDAPLRSPQSDVRQSVERFIRGLLPAGMLQ
jgi:hypothetical protein